MPRHKQPELTFQQHIADFLVREHGYESRKGDRLLFKGLRQR